MGRVLFAAVLVALTVMPAPAASRLTVVDRRATGRGATIAWTLPAGVVPISKGAGVDAGAIGASLRIGADGATGSVTAPEGVFDGTSGWLASTTTRARYRDTRAGAAVRSTVVREGAKIVLKGGSPGDGLLDVFAGGPPGDPVFVSFQVTNGALTLHHCVAYRSCTHRTLAGGGFRLVCDGAEADALCQAVPSGCGNGVRETGEPCDGGAYCTPDCTFPSPSPGCCQAQASCRAADGFVLYFSLYSYCGPAGLPDAQAPVPGGICSASGTCDVLPVQPVPFCCQVGGACSGETAADTGDLWNFRNVCVGSQGGTVVPAAVCGAGGTCEPG